MSGTSMDAVDAVLVDFDNNAVSVLAYRQFAIGKKIQDAVRRVSADSSIMVITELDCQLAEIFADAVNSLLKLAGLSNEMVSAIGSHGQTVLHLPEASHPRTLQIGDPNIIANRTGITTVSDFRRMDLASGGQGAPLACAFHAHYFQHQKMTRVVLNIGGIANITILPAAQKDTVVGLDTGPGNGLMDAWIQEQQSQDYDKNGDWARAGIPNEALLSKLLDDEYFSRQAPKSTGKDEFNLNWLNKQLSSLGIEVSAQDVQATLLELSARSICEAISASADAAAEIIICGGGVHNVFLVERLSALLPDAQIVSSSVHGIDPDAMEAIVFAWLAKQRLEESPANLPAVTGAKNAVVLGGVYSPAQT